MDQAGQTLGRSALIDAAERLIAEQGPAVSLRQVVAAAGQRNSAAIRYHFGTRDDLIGAVIDARQSVFEPRRLERLAALESEGDVTARGLVEALLEPVFEYQRVCSPSYHARFMEKVRDYPGVDLTGRRDWAATTLILHRLAALEAPQPKGRNGFRSRGLITVVFALLADLERQECGSRRERTLAEQSALGMVLAVVNSPAVSATPTRRPR